MAGTAGFGSLRADEASGRGADIANAIELLGVKPS